MALTEAEIRGLCINARELFLSQSILLELKAPVKICGNVQKAVHEKLKHVESVPIGIKKKKKKRERERERERSQYGRIGFEVNPFSAHHFLFLFLSLPHTHTHTHTHTVSR